METYVLANGASVDIKRSNGRVHSAIVSHIDHTKGLVHVEWYENDETKGKEIDLNVIYNLNPSFRPPSHMGQKEVAGRPSHAELDGRGRAGAGPLREHQSYSQSSSDIAAMQNGRGGMAGDSGGAAIRPGYSSNDISSRKSRAMGPPADLSSAAVGGAGAGGLSRIRQPRMRQNATFSNGLARENNGAINTTISESRVHDYGSNVTAATAGDNSDSDMVRMAKKTNSDLSTAGASGSNVTRPSDRRKSNCVREVERIEQNRKERRAQAAVRDTVVDKSHPNWELLNMIQEYQVTLDYRPITNSDPITDHQICVCVRKRPLSRKELKNREVDVVTIPNKENVIVHEPKTKVDLTKFLENHNFRFDYAFDESSNNEIIYRYTAAPLVSFIFDGGYATCFAYGQTGSGKTHTMGGEFSSKNAQDVKKGIYYLSACDVFSLLQSPKYRQLQLAVTASFFEIYSGKVFDLLNNKEKLRVLEDGKQVVQVVGLTEVPISRPNDVLELLSRGNESRTSGQTSANSNSSRSHAVFQIVLRRRGMKNIYGKFSLIDLAGNERGVDTMSCHRSVRMEGAEINKSLLALKECIRALGRKGAHLPFRVSKLTQVLRDSFIGDRSKTCMIAMISPSQLSCEHTLNTLRYADRVKELGPGDPNQVREDLPVAGGANASAPVNNDLVLLRSTNEHDISDEMIKFQEVVSQLEDMEEQIMDDIQKALEESDSSTAELKRVMRTLQQVDFNQDQLAARALSTVRSNLAAFQQLEADLVAYQAQLNNEEKLSQTLQPKGR